jgi:hypothetical protein
MNETERFYDLVNSDHQFSVLFPAKCNNLDISKHVYVFCMWQEVSKPYDDMLLLYRHVPNGRNKTKYECISFLTPLISKTVRSEP